MLWPTRATGALGGTDGDVRLAHLAATKPIKRSMAARKVGALAKGDLGVEAEAVPVRSVHQLGMT